MPFLAPKCAPWFSNNTPLQATPRLFLHSLWHSFVSYFFSIGLEDCSRLVMLNLQLHGNAVAAWEHRRMVCRRALNHYKL